MKKYVVAGVIVLIIVGSLMALETGSKVSNRMLRVAFPAKEAVSAYEPTRIHLGHEYIFLQNIYSPLVETSSAGGPLNPGVAESYSWVGDDLHLRIRSDLKTVSGIPISAQDVVFSLKRLLVLAGNTHGNFRDLICPGEHLSSIDQECAGIRLQGDNVVLSAGSRKPFLLPMLAAIDFAIIPRSSVDPKTLQITNYKETSGPYFVSSDDGQGNIELSMNPYHYHASPQIPQKIALVPISREVAKASLTAFANNQVDHLTTVDTSKAEETLTFAQAREDVEVHATSKIRNLLLVFTERGIKELSEKQRRSIGLQLQQVFAEIYEGVPGYERSYSFFPAMSDGGLANDQIEYLGSLENDDQSADSPSFRLALLRTGSLEPWASAIKSKMPKADFYLEKNVPDFIKYGNPQDVPHAFIASTDTGSTEDISLISYTLSAGYLGLLKSERAGWLAKYMAVPKKERRMELLRDLHFQALRNSTLIPLVMCPFVALVRKPWKMELSELYADNPLWLIKAQ